MNAVSVCDGISAASVACEGLGYRFLLLSEIDNFPRSVLKQRHRAVDQRRYQPRHTAAGRPVLWGDFTALRPRHLRRFHGHADVDVLFGGTPCQSFSVAGKRAGLDDPRGDLSLEYALLAYRLGVRWFLWENVPGVLSSAKGRDFAAILSAFTGRVVEVPRDGWQTAGVIPTAGPGQFGVAWRTFDAQYAGVPQRRRRVFVVGYLGDHRRAAAVLFDRESLQGHPAPSRKPGQGLTYDVAPCLGASDRGFERAGDTRGQDCVVASTGDIAHCLNGGGMGRQDFETETLLAVGGFPDAPINFREWADGAVGVTQQAAIEQPTNAGPLAFSCKDHGADVGEISPTLRSMGHDGSHANAGGQVAVAISANQRGEVRERPVHGSLAATKSGKQFDGVLQGMAVRRLTPLECERLQGFPDHYTLVTHRKKPAKDGPRYKALGNSWAVPCVRWIVERMKAVDRL